MRTDSTTSTAVAHKRIAQCFLQRTEPWFVVPPIRQAVAADGTANLLGARGANTANRFVKLQACRLEGQRAELEQTPYVATEILYHILVVHCQDFPW